MASQDDNRLYVVDGTSQLYRAYFAIRGLARGDGLPTNAIYGFATMLRKLLKEQRPTRIAVAFDPPGPTFRHAQFADYKAHRPPTPEDLIVQAPYAREVCRVLGVPLVEVAGFEADDVIATIVTAARRQGLEVVVVGGDKDLLQLVGEGVTLFNPARETYLDAAGVGASFGVPPDRVRDVLGLMGDTVDNIPGVPGVGPKTAVALVATYGGMDAVIERAARFVAAFDARDRVLETLAGGGAGAGEASRVLADLDRDLAALVEVEVDAALADRLRVVRALLGRDTSPAALKRELKALDKGSSRRIWYAIAEHAEQARQSRELATLHHRVPLDVQPGELRLAPPDREAARALFESLGFRSLVPDFASGGDEERGPAPERREPAAVRHEAVLDLGRLAEVAAACGGAARLALEVVVEGQDAQQARLVGIALSAQAGESYYLPLALAYLGAPAPLPIEPLRDPLAPLLGPAGPPKVGHDLKFASHVLRRHGLELGNWGLDTTVAAFLLDSGRLGYALERLVHEILGQTLAPLETSTGSAARRIPASEIGLERMRDHAGARAEAVLRLGQTLAERLEQSGLDRLYREIDAPLLPLLARMEARGIRVDVARLHEMSGEMASTLERLRGEIHALAGGEFNLDSPKQLREVLFERLGLTPRRKTAKAREASTDAQTLEALSDEHVIARKLLDYRELAKLKGTYVDSLPRLVHPETGRVHTCFHPTGAATGRLSSSDPNLQNIPARTEAGLRIRGAFVAEPGFVFLASDYSQIELRVLAHLAEDPGLIAAFEAGEDIHRHTAAAIFGVHPDLVSGEMRRRAKAVNFGILYGMSELRLAREQGMSRQDASRFMAAYFERFPRVRAYIESVREQALRDAAVRTLFDRVRPFPQLRQRLGRVEREQALRAAVNTTIQGTAADLMKLAMLRVEAALEAGGCEARLLLQVHDELLLEVPEPEVSSVTERVRGAMELVHRLRVPLVVDQKTGKTWKDVT